MSFSKELLDRFKLFEGNIPWMYLDTVGKVTIGVGHQLPNESSAATLAFLKRVGGAAATEAEKKAEWNLIHGKEAGHTANFYKPFTTMELSSTDIDTLLTQDLTVREDDLQDLYSEYDTFPEKAKEGLLDMIFNLGKSKLKNDFPKFNAAVAAKDWDKAAAECKRGGISNTRNDAIKQLFLDA